MVYSYMSPHGTRDLVGDKFTSPVVGTRSSALGHGIY